MDKGDNPEVVVLAIACAPYGGSEGKVGWEGVLAISTFARVRVLTAGHNRRDWERARKEGLVPDGVDVEFLGTVRSWHSNRLIARGQSWQRYLAFMREVNRILPKMIRNHRPDLIHHLTYVILAGQSARASLVAVIPRWVIVSSAAIAVGGLLAKLIPQTGLLLYQFYSGFKPDLSDVIDPYAVQTGIGRESLLRPFAFAMAAFVGAKCSPVRLVRPEN